MTVIGGVNDGAEAITDNSLHIYGRGLGRLVAGATGDKEARIFAKNSIHLWCQLQVLIACVMPSQAR